jgi:peptide/nickel transport system permease protein
VASFGIDAVERIEEFESLQGTTEPAPVAGTAPRSALGLVFWICFAWVALMILLAIFASVLPLTNPNFQNYAFVNSAPSIHHLLGTDDLGRDLLSRIIFGSRVSFVIGFASVGLALLVGGSLGLLAGYRGGSVDTLLNAGSLVVLAFPALLAILVVEAFWGRSLFKLTIVFAVAGAPQLFRVIRATALSFGNREFVTAARTMGATTWRILVKELLPNVIPAAVSFALIGVAVAIILEGSLAFLGLSISLPTASLGNIINEGVVNNNLALNPYIALWPSIYIFLLLVALNLMADRLRDRFDVRAGNL